MKAYWKLIVVLLGVLLFTGTAQGTLIVTDSQEVLIGGNGTHNFTINCVLDGQAGPHDLTVTFHNASTGTPTDKLTGYITYSDSIPDISLEKTDYWTPSQPTYSWNAPQKGKYNFTLTVEVNQSVSLQGESIDIMISDNDASKTTTTTLTVDSVSVPELSSVVLVGIGLISLTIWHRRN